MDLLKRLISSQKIIEKASFSKENKSKTIKKLNKIASEIGVETVSKKADIKTLRNFKNRLLERNGYDILVQSVNEGKHIIAERYSKESYLKNAKNKDTKRLAKNAKELSNAKYKQNRRTSKATQKVLNDSNINVIGFNKNDVVTLFESTKNDKEVKGLIKQINNTKPDTQLNDYQDKIYDRVFKRINISHAKEINELKQYLKTSSPGERMSALIHFQESLELYGSDQLQDTNETKVLESRLKDMLYYTGLRKTGKTVLKREFNRRK